MKELEIPSGGMPFTGDDLLWMQGGLREALEATVKPFTIGGKIILAGCTTTESSGSTIIAPGYVVLNNRICYFPGKTVAGTNLSIHEFYLKSEYDPAGNDVFADSVSRDTYLKVSIDVRSFTSETDETLRLSRLNEYRINLPKVESYTFTANSGATSIRFTRYGPFVNIYGYIAPAFPLGSTQNMNLPQQFLVAPTNLPVHFSETVLGRVNIALGLITAHSTVAPVTGFGIISTTLLAIY